MTEGALNNTAAEMQRILGVPPLDNGERDTFRKLFQLLSKYLSVRLLHIFVENIEPVHSNSFYNMGYIL